MKATIFTVSSLLALTSAFPCFVPASTVTIRLISPPSLSTTYYAQAPNQNALTTTHGETLHLRVGQVFSLDHMPRHVQAIEISNISFGTDLSSPSRLVATSDVDVVCQAKTGHGSSGKEFGIEDGMVQLTETGGQATVTAVECWLK